MSLLLLLVIYLLLLPQQLTPDHLESFLRFANEPGLSVTYVWQDKCFQIDGRIPRHCRHKKTYYFVSHWDREHVPRSPPRNVYCKDSPKVIARFKKWDTIRDCPLSTEIQVIDHGQETMDSNDASRVFYFPRLGVLVLGDTHYRSQTRLREALAKKNLLPSLKWIILAQQGNRNAVNENFHRFFPGIWGGLVNSRTLRGIKKSRLHPRTRKVFSDGRKVLLDSKDWGNLIFEF